MGPPRASSKSPRRRPYRRRSNPPRACAPPRTPRRTTRATTTPKPSNRRPARVARACPAAWQHPRRESRRRAGARMTPSEPFDVAAHRPRSSREAHLRAPAAPLIKRSPPRRRGAAARLRRGASAAAAVAPRPLDRRARRSREQPRSPSSRAAPGLGSPPPVAAPGRRSSRSERSSLLASELRALPGRRLDLRCRRDLVSEKRPPPRCRRAPPRSSRRGDPLGAPPPRPGSSPRRPRHGSAGAASICAAPSCFLRVAPPSSSAPR